MIYIHTYVTYIRYSVFTNHIICIFNLWYDLILCDVAWYDMTWMIFLIIWYSYVFCLVFLWIAIHTSPTIWPGFVHCAGWGNASQYADRSPWTMALLMEHTADGPAKSCTTKRMVKTLEIMGNTTELSTGARCLPSTVAMEIAHL